MILYRSNQLDKDNEPYMNSFVGLLSNWTIEPFLAFSNDIIHLEIFDFELLIAKTVRTELVSILTFMIESVSIEERAPETPWPPFRIQKVTNKVHCLTLNNHIRMITTQNHFVWEEIFILGTIASIINDNHLWFQHFYLVPAHFG